jgi:type I restriction enzyme S subunit
MSAEGWKIFKVGELGRVVTGKTPSTQILKNFGDKYPFITPRDMTGQKRIGNTERYLSEEGKISVKNCLLPINAICVSCIGSDMGKVVITSQDSVTNQQLNSIICRDSFNPDFIYYSVIGIFRF